MIVIRTFLSLVIVFTAAFQVNAQLKVDTLQTVDHLVQNVLLGKGVEAENIQYKGASGSLGLFVNDSTKLPFRKGILLTTGRVHDALGPNKLPRTSGVHQYPGDPDLDFISEGKTYDAAILEFDFTPTSSELSFNFVFASEEYTEFVNQGFNDVFAFVVSGPGIPARANIAVLPGTTTPITINNINDVTNKEYYIDNNLWDRQTKLIKGKEDSLFSEETPYTIEYDGFTTVLNARLTVQANKKYHIAIKIADVGDFGLDSGVFLEAGSFVSKPSETADASGINSSTTTTDTTRPTGNATTSSTTNSASTPTIYFDHDSYALSEQDKKKLDALAIQLSKLSGVTLNIIGHTDGDGSEAYNDELSKKRAEAVKNYLLNKGVHRNQMIVYARSEREPKASNSTPDGKAKNRRVEFNLIK